MSFFETEHPTDIGCYRLKAIKENAQFTYYKNFIMQA